MKYDRYIDNRIIQACIRPQLPKWCGPTTISEIVQILLKKTICPHEVARIMKWSGESNQGIASTAGTAGTAGTEGVGLTALTKGMGTSMVLKGLAVVSKGMIKSEIIDVLQYKKASLWNLIKKIILNQKELLYIHEQGHHVLIGGFLEEPVITAESFKAGIDCSKSIPHPLPSSRFHPSSILETQSKWSETRRILINAEHNIKDPETKGIGSILKERNFDEVDDELRMNASRLHLVRIYK